MYRLLGGGDMIASVGTEGSTFREAPNRFEAGTPHVAGVIGLGAAIEFLNTIDRTAALEHEAQLLRQTKAGLLAIPEVRLLAPEAEHVALVSFAIDGIHPHDVAQGFSSHSVALRAGHHCAQPLMKALGLSASSRASFGIYSNASDVEAFLAALKKVIAFFKR
jgi:cysteine desulfurase/selenocysteine lyase